MPLMLSLSLPAAVGLAWLGLVAPGDAAAPMSCASIWKKVRTIHEISFVNRKENGMCVYACGSTDWWLDVAKCRPSGPPPAPPEDTYGWRVRFEAAECPPPKKEFCCVAKEGETFVPEICPAPPVP